MKRVFWVILAIPFLLANAANKSNAQGFINLNFSHSTIVTNFLPELSVANVTGWSVYNAAFDNNYANGMSVIYNNQTLDDSGVSLIDTNFAISAIPSGNEKYSILLLGGTQWAENGHNGASIGQTGMIPITAQSLTYWGYSWDRLQVSFDGQSLPISIVSTATDHVVYGVDVSAYSGQTGMLLFTAPWLDGQGYTSEGVIGEIAFSSMAVPEPPTLGLAVFSCGLFLLRKFKFSI